MTEKLTPGVAPICDGKVQFEHALLSKTKGGDRQDRLGIAPPPVRPLVRAVAVGR